MKKFELKSIAVFLLLLTDTLVFAQNGFNISMELNGFKDGTKIRLINLDLGEAIDSSYVADGRVTFKGMVTKPAPAWITSPDKYMVLYLENKHIKIIADHSNFRFARIEGSEINSAWTKSRDWLKPYDLRRDSLMLQFRSLPGSDKHTGKAILAEIDKIDSVMFQYRFEYIKHEKPSYFTMNELFFIRSIVDRDSLQSLFNRFPKDLQATDPGIVVRNYLTNPKPAIGSRFINVAGTDISGKGSKLSDLKGKYVLLDFWASWCVPCRQENPEFVKIYEQYKARGFEIYGFSTDLNKAAWVKAVKADKLPWTNASDLKGFYSKATVNYQVRGLPQNFLINPKGIIIATELRGEGLAKKLKEIFKEK